MAICIMFRLTILVGNRLVREFIDYGFKFVFSYHKPIVIVTFTSLLLHLFFLFLVATAMPIILEEEG